MYWRNNDVILLLWLLIFLFLCKLYFTAIFTFVFHITVIEDYRYGEQPLEAYWSQSVIPFYDYHGLNFLEAQIVNCMHVIQKPIFKRNRHKYWRSFRKLKC